MRIERIELKNWRNFKSAVAPLESLTFLVGPNAAGKSNFLDAFRFLRDLATAGGGGLQKAMSDRGGMTKVRCLVARQKPNVELHVFLSEAVSSTAAEESPVRWEYHLGLSQEKEIRGNGLPIVTFERVVRDGVEILSRPDSDDDRDPQRLTQTHLEQINSNAGFRQMVEHFAATTYLHLVPQLLRHPDAFSGPGITGDPFGRGFLDRLARTSERKRTSRLSWIEKALRKVVPKLKDLKFVKDDSGVPHLEATYEHWRPNAGKQREDQFSDGTLRLIALFWSLLDGNSLLLLEEPELSLNDAVVEQLAPLLARSQRKSSRQIIVSSHSPSLLGDKGIRADGVLLLNPGENGTEVVRMTDVDPLRTLVEADESVGEIVREHIRSQQLVLPFGSLNP